MITMIPRSRLEPHPDNPRKELGDLTELTASIARQGILQNLTVVPSPDDPGKYRIVIGHRRFAAAGMAGLEHLPCSIDEKMTYPEQIAVMMSENMQRTDLTVTERVGGVQTMLELGMGIAEIAGNTGISETTVRRYAKIAKLNSGNMNAAENRGATLMNFIEISEIESDALRAEALEAVGTNNYNRVMWKVRNERDRKNRLPLMLEKLSQFATQIDEHDWNKHAYVDCYRFCDAEVLSKIARPKAKNEYVYTVEEYTVTLYEVRKQEDDAKLKAKREGEARIRLRANHERDISDRFRAMRDAYMQTMTIKGREEAAKRFILFVLTRSVYLETAMINGLFDQAFLAQREHRPKSTTCSIAVTCEDIDDIPEKQLLHGIVLVAYDRIRNRNCSMMDSYSGRMKEEEQTAFIRELYRRMEDMGYPTGDEERAWLDGTHECYTYAAAPKEDAQK